MHYNMFTTIDKFAKVVRTDIVIEFLMIINDSMM